MNTLDRLSSTLDAIRHRSLLRVREDELINSVTLRHGMKLGSRLLKTLLEESDPPQTEAEGYEFYLLEQVAQKVEDVEVRSRRNLDMVYPLEGKKRLVCNSDPLRKPVTCRYPSWVAKQDALWRYL